jgi:transposase-like protein
MAHPNARLAPAGRLILVGRIAAQPRRPIAHIAHEMGISRTTAYRWWVRYQQSGEAGLVDRPSSPLASPRRTAARLEHRILRLRRHKTTYLSPAAALAVATASSMSPLRTVKPAGRSLGGWWLSTNWGPVQAPPYGQPSSVLATW